MGSGKGQESRYGLIILASVCVNYFLENFLRVAPSALSPVLIEELGITHGMAGLLISSYSVLYSAMQVPAGVLSDSIGPRRTIIGFTLFSVVGGLLFYLGSRVEVLIAAQVLIGLGFSVFYVNAVKLISGWFPPRRQATAVGILSAALGMGSFTAYLGFPLSMGLVGGWKTVYFYSLALLLANLVANIIILRDGPSRTTGAKADGIRQTLIDVLRRRRLYPLLVGYILAGFSWVFASWLPQFLTDARGFSYVEAGFISSVGTLSGILGSILIGAISDWLRSRKLPLVAFSIAYTCLLALFLSLPGQASIEAFLAVTAARGFTVSLWVLLFSMVPETLPEDRTGMGLGVLNGVGTLGFALLTPIYGVLVDVTRGYLTSNAVILSGGVLMTVVFALFTLETYGGRENPPIEHKNGYS